VKLLAGVYARPGFVHRHLHPSVSTVPSEDPADSSLLIANTVPFADLY
jgi:hypothetical protein